MKKPLLSLILLMFLVGNAFADDCAHYSLGQKLYIPFSQNTGFLPSVNEYQYMFMRVIVRNFDGDARIEYFEYHGVDPITGDLLLPEKLNLSVSSDDPQSFDLPPWRSWFWFTTDFWGPPTKPLANRQIPFVIVKWVSTNGRRITAPSFEAYLIILQGPTYGTARMLVHIPLGVKILEELSYWR
jgi:hypothetical protein